MKEHFIRLFNYNDWANERCFHSFKEINAGKPAKLFSHIIASQNIWLSRVLLKESNPFSPWTEFPDDELLKLAKKSSINWQNFLNRTEDKSLDKLIKYQNSKGENFEVKISEIINHVINHSAYHRGQIASLVRLNGGNPAVTDYIVFARLI